MKTISVVTPCFNEEGNVREVYERVRDLMLRLGNYRYEHIHTQVHNRPLVVERERLNFRYEPGELLPATLSLRTRPLAHRAYPG